MMVSSDHERLTAAQREKIEDVAKRLGIEAVRCSMGEADTSDGYQGWDGQHPMLSNGVGEGILYTTKHGALLAAMRLIKELIP